MMVNQTQNNYVLLEFLVLVIISYIGACAYSSLFEVQIGEVIGSYPIFRLLPHQRSDPNSIIFSAAYLTRLVSSIALNFLHVINYNKTVPPSPFFTVMQSDPIQDSIYNYFPIILGIICLGTLFNVYHYIKSCFCYDKIFYYAEDFKDEQIDHGEDILRREKEARGRKPPSTIVRGIMDSNMIKEDRPRNPDLKIVPLEELEIEPDLEPVETTEPEKPGNKVGDFFKSFIRLPLALLGNTKAGDSTPPSDDSEAALLAETSTPPSPKSESKTITRVPEEKSASGPGNKPVFQKPSVSNQKFAWERSSPPENKKKTIYPCFPVKYPVNSVFVPNKKRS